MNLEKKARILALKEKVAPHMSKLTAARAAIADLEAAASEDIKALVEEAPAGALFSFDGSEYKFRKHPRSGHYYGLPAASEVL